MSKTTSCCCDSSTVPPVQVPGAPGQDGAAGSDGADGINAYSYLTAALVVPASGNTVTAYIGNASWMVVGQIVVAEGPANFEVVSVLTGSAGALLKFKAYVGDVSAGATIAAGAKIGPSGTQSPFVGTLPTAFTDNSGGTQSNAINSGVGKRSLAFYSQLSSIADGTWVGTFAPGFAFKIISIQFLVGLAATTASKTTTLTPAINGTAVTGGALTLTSANCTPQGAVIDGSAITGGNTGSNTDTISVVASATTAFANGTGWILLELQNLDDRDAYASLAKHVNDLITALT